MGSLNEYMSEYKKQIERGYINKAYKGLMEFIMNLRTHFMKKYHDYYVSGNIYYGYMDMTYFSFSPRSLRENGLKIALVFVHEKISFEVWLAASNKTIQTKYWKLFREKWGSKYRIPSSTKGYDSIVECTLIENPDFDDLKSLEDRIEKGTLKFIDDIQNFLSENQ